MVSSLVRRTRTRKVSRIAENDCVLLSVRGTLENLGVLAKIFRHPIQTMPRREVIGPHTWWVDRNRIMVKPPRAGKCIFYFMQSLHNRSSAV